MEHVGNVHFLGGAIAVVVVLIRIVNTTMVVYVRYARLDMGLQVSVAEHVSLAFLTAITVPFITIASNVIIHLEYKMEPV